MDRSSTSGRGGEGESRKMAGVKAGVARKRKERRTEFRFSNLRWRVKYTCKCMRIYLSVCVCERIANFTVNAFNGSQMESAGGNVNNQCNFTAELG